MAEIIVDKLGRASVGVDKGEDPARILQLIEALRKAGFNIPNANIGPQEQHRHDADPSVKIAGRS